MQVSLQNEDGGAFNPASKLKLRRWIVSVHGSLLDNLYILVVRFAARNSKQIVKDKI